jgi:7-cyano-7-deazaguanine synthase
MKKTVILLSGGIDSTVAAWKLRREGHTLIPVTFITYRRNKREIEAVEKIVDTAGGYGLRILDTSYLRELFDFPPKQAEKIYSSLNNPPNILIPYRNIIFYSIAAHIACYEDAEYVAGGHTYEDLGRLPDVGETFFNNLGALLKQSLKGFEVRFLAPLISLRKPQVIKLGAELNAPLKLTWSCWSVYEKHCGTCPGCLARKQSFRDAGVEDLTEYLE